MATSTSTSSPGSKLLRTLPRPENRTLGRTPAGSEIVIEPETVRARTGARAAETMLTFPLTERTSTVPDAASTPTEPDTVESSASSVVPTVIRPLVFETRQRPSHSSSSTDPETVRRSALAAAPTRIEPLCEVTLTAPKRPCNSTRPDRVPTITSAPGGHRTTTDDDRPALTSTAPSAEASAEPPRSTTTSSRGSAITVTRPDVALIRRRTGVSIVGGSMTGILAIMRAVEEPHGGLTLVFTDIEGSTVLLRELKGSYGLLLRVHHRMLERAFEEHRGRSMGSEGDSLFFVFPTAHDAVLGAVTAQQRVEHHSWPDGVRLRVRIGIHSGPVTISGGEYVGLTVHEVSRICAVAHGGQIVCSSSVADALGGDVGAELRELGTFVLRGFPAGTRLFQVCAPGLDDEFPSPRDTIRAGGARMSVWFRETPGPSHAALSPADALDFETTAGEQLGGGLNVEILPSGRERPGAFRLVVTRGGNVEEEYDGLTIGGTTDATTVVNAHSRLIRIVPRGLRVP
jgi:class 3 adenylate cyclase